MSATVDVIGFVMEAIRNSVSRRMGRPPFKSCAPKLDESMTWPSRQINVTAPANSPLATMDFSTASITLLA
jgi:hypothetical protein